MDLLQHLEDQFAYYHDAAEQSQLYLAAQQREAGRAALACAEARSFPCPDVHARDRHLNAVVLDMSVTIRSFKRLAQMNVYNLMLLGSR